MRWAISEDEFNVARQRQEIIKIGLDIYSYTGLSKGDYVGRISGGVVSGSANINADSDIRRTFTINLVPDKESKELINQRGYLWIDKMVDVSLGLVRTFEETIYWKKFGRFVFTSTNTSYDATNNQLTLNCSDLMSTLDGSINGELGQLSIVFPAYKEYRSDDPTIHYWHQAIADPDPNLTFLFYSLSDTPDVPQKKVTSHASGDYYVVGIPRTNTGRDYLYVQGISGGLPIVDRDGNWIKKGVLRKGGVYSFYIKDGKAMLSRDDSLTNVSEYQIYDLTNPPLDYTYYTDRRSLKMTPLDSIDYNDLADHSVSFANEIKPENCILVSLENLVNANDKTTVLNTSFGAFPIGKVYWSYYTEIQSADIGEVTEYALTKDQTYVAYVDRNIDGGLDLYIPVKSKPTSSKPKLNQDLEIRSGMVSYKLFSGTDVSKEYSNKSIGVFYCRFSARTNSLSENCYFLNTTYDTFASGKYPSANDCIKIRVSQSNTESPQLLINNEERYSIYINDTTRVTTGYFHTGTTYTLQYIEGRGFMVYTADPHPIDVIEGTPLCYYTIRDAVKSIVTQLANIPENGYFIDEIGEYKAMPGYNVDWEQYRAENPLWNNIPYDLEFSHGDTVLTILQKIRDLYPNYEVYFDEEGTFRMDLIPSGDEDPILVNNYFLQDVLVSDSVTTDLTPVRNLCHVWGKVIETDFYSDQVTYGSSGSVQPTTPKPETPSFTSGSIVYTHQGGGSIEPTTVINSAITFNYKFNTIFWSPNWKRFPIGTKLVLQIPESGEWNASKDQYGLDLPVRYLGIQNPYGTVGYIDPDVGFNPNYPYGDTVEVYPFLQRIGETEGTIKYIYEKDRIRHSGIRPGHKYIFEVVNYLLYEGEVKYKEEGGRLIPVDPDHRGLKLLGDYDIPIYDDTNTYKANIEGYDDTYKNGDIIALKIPISNGSNAKININNYGPILIYDDVKNVPIEAGSLKENETYGFKIRKQRIKVGDNEYVDNTVALLLGSWQVQAMRVLVSDLNGVPKDPDEEKDRKQNYYQTEDGRRIRKLTKEYFQEAYACPEVEMVVLPNSPFTCQRIGERMSVYIDETSLTSCSLAAARADYELYRLARLPDSISITTKLCLFADVNMKVSYKHPAWTDTNSYIVKSISHDLSGGTTTWELMRFYPLYGNLGLTHDEIKGVDSGTHQPSPDLYPYMHDELSAYTHERIRGV